MKRNISAFILIALVILGFRYSNTNFDRLVLGSGNYGTDPNPTADITLQNDEYISNSSNGTISLGAANLTTSGYLDLGTSVAGTNAFTTTAEHDTVVISGVTATDIFVVSGKSATLDQQDVLQWTCTTDTLFVHRLAAGQSGLNYSYIRVK